MRKPPLLAALGLAAALAAAPLVRGESAYSSLVGLAAAPDDGHAEEGRLPEGLDRPIGRMAARSGSPAAAPAEASAAAVPVERSAAADPLERAVASPAQTWPVSAAASSRRDSGELRDAVRDEDARAVSGTSAQRSPAWVRVVAYLVPSTRPGIPELKASTSAFAGGRPIRRGAPYVPHETEEGVRRGMADMLAIMSAGSEPPVPPLR